MLRHHEDNFILSITQPQTNEAIGQDSVHQQDTFLNSFETTILNETVGFVNLASVTVKNVCRLEKLQITNPQIIQLY